MGKQSDLKVLLMFLPMFVTLTHDSFYSISAIRSKEFLMRRTLYFHEDWKPALSYSIKDSSTMD